jgi:TetR/AcrR family transcriptional regulator, cholesterol catabolism regulator
MVIAGPSGPVVPALPSTPSQRQRYERILQVANALLAAGGEDALHMKALAERSGVAHRTLYRYFPSKDYLWLAIALDRYERALEVVQRTRFEGDTPGERVQELLLRQFRAEQRAPLVTAATARVMHHTDRTYSEMLEKISAVQQQCLRYAAQGDGPPLSIPFQRALIVVASSFGSATLGWLSGVRSAADAKFEIRLACRLLDLPEETLQAEMDAS